MSRGIRRRTRPWFPAAVRAGVLAGGMAAHLINPAAGQEEPAPADMPIAATAEGESAAAAGAEEPQSAAPAAASAANGPHASPAATGAIEKFLDAGRRRDAHTASFQELTPGVSSEADVRAKLGEPQDTEMTGTAAIWHYQIGPFPRVQLEIAAGILQQTRIHLGQPTSVASIEADLQLARFESSPLYSPRGETLGLVYPERGMLVHFSAPVDARANEAEEPLAELVVLRPIRATDFLDRIRFDVTMNYHERLLDAEQALALEPGNEDALWFRARLLEKAGFPEYARLQLTTAMEAVADTPRLRLENARLTARCGDRVAARTATEQILTRTDLSPLVRARAQLQLAEVQAHTSIAEYKAAVKHFMDAIASASLVTKEGAFAGRREARQLILEAHLGVADAIARGGFRNKVETVKKWLTNAEAIAQRMRDTDHVPPTIHVQVWSAELRAYVALEDAMDPQSTVEPLVREADLLLAQSPDELFQRYLRTVYGEALLDAAAVFQRRGEIEQAQTAARRAAEVLSEIAQRQPPHVRSEFLLGKAYFTQGAIAAVALQDHALAVKFYDRAWPLLAQEFPASAGVDAVVLGEQFVSMGISYWQVSDRERGTDVTERGVQLIQANAGSARAAGALRTAYHNLAVMHETLGATEKAASFAQRARELDEGTTRR